MISLKKYLDSAESTPLKEEALVTDGLLAAVLKSYQSALLEVGKSAVTACPAIAQASKAELDGIASRITADISIQAAAETEDQVRKVLTEWGGRIALHYDSKAREVKDLLLVLARTAQSVGQRDTACALQMNQVTERLKDIASLDDLSQIRVSVQQSATELTASIDRMTTAGNSAMEQLRAEVSAYRTRLEEAEYIASCDALTGLGSRLWTESQLEQRIEAQVIFCAIVLDINGFKHVNDVYGHMVGDDLLKQFATELQFACGSDCVIGRWGGDEFLVLMDCDLQTAKGRTARVQEWVCGIYDLRGRNGVLKIRVDASFGMAEYSPGETLAVFLDRADSGMYTHKAATRKQ
jgi:diguanylate cyclase (GGDEF)-like protein